MMLEKQLVVALLMLFYPLAAYAYIGPGLGLGTIGLVLGILGAIILAFFAILWYPLKRFFRGKGSNEESKREEKSEDRENDESDPG